MLASRREFLLRAGGGSGAIALASLMSAQVGAGQPPASGIAPRVKRVIWLFMHGGPSHVDLFDPKPDLVRLAGQPDPG